MKKLLARIAMSFLVASLLPLACDAAEGPTDSKDFEKPLSVTFGGFLDSYYANDFNNPVNHDRAFTTQPARNNEFNVNLVDLDAKITADRVRGRVAIQAGTSVQSNYASEPTVGTVSGPSLARNIQEAYVGYRVSEKLWVDGGIYFSHIGFESWQSKDNWAYTRSIMADFSPYYQSGVKASYQWTDKFSTQFHLLNGWQNISENNSNKAVGIQAAYNWSDSTSFTYNNFFGNEVSSQHRFFNDFIAKLGITNALSVAASYDIGLQQTPGGKSMATWQAYAMFLRYQFAPKFAMTLREEQYFDPKQVIVTTGTPNGFQTGGASLTADLALHKQVLWRTEVRGFKSKDKIYPKNSTIADSDGFLVTSLSLWF